MAKKSKPLQVFLEENSLLILIFQTFTLAAEVK